MNDATKSAFKKWYEKDKDKLSEKRKQRYQSDAAYRAMCIARAAERRAKFPAPSRAEMPIFKEVNGKSVEVFRISEVGQMIGIGIQTIRAWEVSGLVPKPTVKSFHRNYTKFQIALMKELADLSHQHRYDRENRTSILESKSTEVWKKWDQLE